MSKEWPRVRLGEVLERREPSVQVDAAENYQFAGVFSFGRGVFRGQARLGNQFSYRRLSRLQTGDFTYPKLMAWEGAFGVVPPECDGCYVSPEFPVFAPRSDRIASDFLGFYFRIPSVWEVVSGGSTGTNVRRRRLHPDDFLRAEIPLPPMAEQRRVVARIEELVAQINEARILRRQATEQAGALLVSHSRVQFDPPHCAEWQKMRIADACEAMIDYRGRTPPISESGIPHVTSANIKEGKINWHTPKFVTEATYAEFMTRGIPRPQDVLFTMEAPLGEVGVVPDNRKFSLAQRVILLRPKAAVLIGEFLARALSSPNVRDAIFSKATATTVSGIASKRLKEVHVPVPPLLEQRRIVTELDALQSEVDALKRLQAETAVEIAALLPAVLDRAFKGEL
jgi:type I restriction enzyme, S subunit